MNKRMITHKGGNKWVLEWKDPKTQKPKILSFQWDNLPPILNGKVINLIEKNLVNGNPLKFEFEGTV